ncbi:flagellar FlbD family protein [Microbacterium sp. STN6]|uniref:flagellar FlbD family protein n=1 Tax=Microbacterium sp. STN6 TaxID=2995588 RepID=UPI00226089E6|nr:flagellar FlbD family protein [Microbacterium sp. STN6]MCX7522388.1 flagellar FlbD family protein [Microbacterium sp. STN6]
MIVVTRLNDSQFAVNPDLIERIHAHPDTTLVLVDGSTFIVTESMSDVIEMIAQYRAHVISLANAQPSAPVHPGAQRLSLVTSEDDTSDQAPRNTVPTAPRVGKN